MEKPTVVMLLEQLALYLVGDPGSFSDKKTAMFDLYCATTAQQHTLDSEPDWGDKAPDAVEGASRGQDYICPDEWWGRLPGRRSPWLGGNV